MFSPSTSSSSTSISGQEENVDTKYKKLPCIKEENEYPSPMRVPLTSNAALLFSPTQNLPNYVLDGEAPHLGLMSPRKRPASRNDNIDWLIKIRKQKMMCSKNICDIKTTTTATTVEHNDHNHIMEWKPGTSDSPIIESPRSFRRRRMSQSSGGRCSPLPSGSGLLSSPASSRTPTSRRKSENSILKFFKVKPPGGDSLSQPQQSIENS